MWLLLMLCASFLSAATYAIDPKPIEITVINHTKRGDCALLLKQVAERVLEGPRATLELGAFALMPEMIENAGLAGGLASAVNRAMQSIVHEALTTEHGVISEVAKSAILDADDENALVICMISGGCRFKEGRSSFHIGSDFGFDIRSLKSTPPAPETNGRMRARTSVKPQRVSIIILGSHPATLIENFFAELSNHVSFLKLRAWVYANLGRLAVELEPDELFRDPDIVRIEGERVVLDEGFVRTFLEIRAQATATEAHRIFNSFLKDQSEITSRQLDFEDRQKAMRAIANWSPAVDHVVAKFQIDEGNVFETERKWNLAMSASVNGETTRNHAPTLSQMGMVPSQQSAAVDDLETQILRAVFPCPPAKRFWQYWGKKPRPKDVPKIRAEQLADMIQEVTAAGGRVVLSQRPSYYFSVDVAGRPEIGLERGTDQGNYASLLTSFREWREQRDLLLKENPKRKDAPVLAAIRGRSPRLLFQSTLAKTVEATRMPGYWSLETLNERFLSGALDTTEVDRLVSILTISHLTSLRATILMRREILRRLLRLGVAIEGTHLEFALESEDDSPPPSFHEVPRLATSKEAGKLILNGVPLVPLSQTSAEIEELLALYDRLETDAREFASGAIQINHVLRERAVQRLRYLSDIARREGQEEVAALHIANAEGIRDKESDLFSQFLFGLGAQVITEKTDGPILRELTLAYEALQLRLKTLPRIQ